MSFSEMLGHKFQLNTVACAVHSAFGLNSVEIPLGRAEYSGVIRGGRWNSCRFVRHLRALRVRLSGRANGSVSHGNDLARGKVVEIPGIGRVVARSLRIRKVVEHCVQAKVVEIRKRKVRTS